MTDQERIYVATKLIPKKVRAKMSTKIHDLVEKRRKANGTCF